MRATYALLFFLGAAGCGTEAGRDCASIATEYLAAFPDAMVCDPGAADPCGAQRPVVITEGGSPSGAKVQGLCWVSSAGYVNPARAAKLDELLSQYSSAGCSIASCAGPTPHTAQCIDRGSGTSTCG